MLKLFASFALVAALATPAALHASMMTGQFSVQGSVTTDATTHTLTFIPDSVQTGFGTQTGTFTTLLSNNEAATGGTAVINYDPYVSGSAFIEIGPLTGTIDSLNEITSVVGGHTVYTFSGMGVLEAAGYDDTPASFSFTTQDTGVVTFSATTIAGSPVPEPSTLALFGTGIFGLAGAVSRKFRA